MPVQARLADMEFFMAKYEVAAARPQTASAGCSLCSVEPRCRVAEMQRARIESNQSTSGKSDTLTR